MTREGELVCPGFMPERTVNRWDTSEMPPILETPRLAIRQFTEDDVDDLFDLNSDPEVMRYLTGGRPTPRHFRPRP